MMTLCGVVGPKAGSRIDCHKMTNDLSYRRLEDWGVQLLYSTNGETEIQVHTFAFVPHNAQFLGA